MPRRRETGAVADRSETQSGQAGSMPSSEPGTATVAGGVAGGGQDPQGEPTLDRIAERAYEIYQRRGGTDGQDMDDWLQAERELRRGTSRD